MNQKIVTNQDLCDAINKQKRSVTSDQNVYLTLYGWFWNHYWFEQETVDLEQETRDLKTLSWTGTGLGK